jgi:hypothetical protein
MLWEISGFPAKKMSTALCWDITQRLVVIAYRHFGTGPETPVRNYHYSLRSNPEHRHSRVCSFFNLTARWSGWLTSRPGRFTLGKETRYLMYRKLGWPQGWSGRVRKILPPTGIPSLDRPPRSERRYRLSYPDPSNTSNLLKPIGNYMYRQV